MLVMEGLSKLINNAKEDGSLKGVGINSMLHFTHILFIDEVILFCCGKFEKWRIFQPRLKIVLCSYRNDG